MEKQDVKIFQERDFGELISVSITFLIQEIKPVIKNLLYIVGPFVLITAILSAIFNVGAANDMTQIVNMIKGDFSQLQQPNSSAAGSFFIGLIAIFQNIMLYTVLGVYVKLYAEKGRGNFDTQDVWKGVTNIFWSVLGGQFLAGLLIIAGIILLIIPGIYISIVMTIVFTIIIFEELGAGEAISRAFKLMKGSWWLTFGTLFVLGILTSIISAIFAGVIGLVFIGGINSIISAIYSAVIGFGSLITSAVVIFLPIFLYASFVTDKENPTLLDRISNISNTKDKAGFSEEIKINEDISTKEVLTKDKDVWEKLIDDNQAKKKTEDADVENKEEKETPTSKSLEKKDDANRFANNDDEIDRFKPKY